MRNVTRCSAAIIDIRPEHVEISTIASEWPAIVKLAQHLSSDTFVHAGADGIALLTARLESDAPLKADQKIFIPPRRAWHACRGFPIDLATRQRSCASIMTQHPLKWRGRGSLIQIKLREDPARTAARNTLSGYG